MKPTPNTRVQVCTLIAQAQSEAFIAQAMGLNIKTLRRQYAFELRYGSQVSRSVVLAPQIAAALSGDEDALKLVRRELGPVPQDWAQLQFANDEHKAYFTKDGKLYHRIAGENGFVYKLVEDRGEPQSAAAETRAAPRHFPMIGYDGEEPAARRGRRPAPTAAERDHVKVLVATDASDEVIAYLTNQSVKSLRSRFAVELQFGNAMVQAKLFRGDFERAGRGDRAAATRALATMGKPTRRPPYREADEHGMKRIYIVTANLGSEETQARVAAGLEEERRRNGG
jgi:hypothetical protein